MPIEVEIGVQLPEREAERPKREGRPRSTRRSKALQWEVEMDLSGKAPRRNMLKSSLGNTKDAHLVCLEDFEQKSDVKLYGQLPDYDDFQVYDLAQEDILRQIALGIYANFHRPSWGTLKHHLLTVKIPKKYLGT